MNIVNLTLLFSVYNWASGLKAFRIKNMIISIIAQIIPKPTNVKEIKTATNRIKPSIAEIIVGSLVRKTINSSKFTSITSQNKKCAAFESYAPKNTPGIQKLCNKSLNTLTISVNETKRIFTEVIYAYCKNNIQLDLLLF